MITTAKFRFFSIAHCLRAKPIAALAALKRVSLAVARSASMHFALRAALQLRKTPVLPFCHSSHSYGYDFRSRAARYVFYHSPSLANL
jgi:hypothetical protein